MIGVAGGCGEGEGGGGVLWPENKSYAKQRRLQFDCDMQHMLRRSADGDGD